MTAEPENSMHTATNATNVLSNAVSIVRRSPPAPPAHQPFHQFPKAARHAGRHRGRGSQRLMNPNEIVIREVKRHLRARVLVDLVRAGLAMAKAERIVAGRCQKSASLTRSPHWRW
jgi:hypothetical protein